MLFNSESTCHIANFNMCARVDILDMYIPYFVERIPHEIDPSAVLLQKC